jgi:hypothetical protein
MMQGRITYEGRSAFPRFPAQGCALPVVIRNSAGWSQYVVDLLWNFQDALRHGGADGRGVEKLRFLLCPGKAVGGREGVGTGAYGRGEMVGERKNGSVH